MGKPLISITIVACLLFGSLYFWKSPDVNHESTRSISSCIYDEKHESDFLSSMGHPFTVSYNGSASNNCMNPHFPAIHITTKTNHNAWIHVISTDSMEKEEQRFIDMLGDKEIAPFYTLEGDFFDAPLWKYRFFSKPLSYWKGHAYAVFVDPVKKTIVFIGGIEWGFCLSKMSILPSMIHPVSLTHKDLQQDWNFLENQLVGYKIMKPNSTD
jgi:hypothetical protein